MKVYVICPTRALAKSMQESMDPFIRSWERDGHKVYYPPRDVKPGTEFEKCQQNLAAMMDCDVVQIFYHKKSIGSHFDLGMAFALGKPIRDTVVFKADGGYTREATVELLKEWRKTEPHTT